MHVAEIMQSLSMNQQANCGNVIQKNLMSHTIESLYFICFDFLKRFYLIHVLTWSWHDLDFKIDHIQHITLTRVITGGCSKFF